MLVLGCGESGLGEKPDFGLIRSRLPPRSHQGAADGAPRASLIVSHLECPEYR